MSTCYFIGWDVGGWNCDRNRESRDALVILDADRSIVGTPWRGNLRKSINDATDAETWLRSLFMLCKANYPGHPSRCVLGIDTPLGFPEAFIRLVARQITPDGIPGSYDANPYLYREAEQFLFDHGISPLSPVKDMIGSQATKGMHVLAKFAPIISSCGVWQHETGLLTAIEAYPAPCKHSRRIGQLQSPFVRWEDAEPRVLDSRLDHQDKLDALTCALVAWLFEHDRASLAPPSPSISANEGWIWVPQDVIDMMTVSRVILE